MVNYCCNFINNLISKYDNDYNISRKHYIDNDNVITIQLIQNRGRSPTRRIGTRAKSPNKLPLLIENKNTYDLTDPNIFVKLNNNLKFHNLYHDKNEKQQIINELININLVNETEFIKNINNSSKTSKLMVKKYILSKLFKINDVDISIDFLNEWLDKEYILDNVAYASEKKKINDVNDPYLNNMKLKKKYIDIILNVFGFKNLFDFETEVTKDDVMEERMKKSNLLDPKEYESIVTVFGKRDLQKQKDNFNIAKFIKLSDSMLNEFGIGLQKKRKRVRKNDKNNKHRVYYYKLYEVKNNIKKLSV